MTKEQQQETDFQALHAACPFAGQGGTYVVKDGVRRLVERTGLDAAGVEQANAAADAVRAKEKE